MLLFGILSLEFRDRPYYKRSGKKIMKAKVKAKEVMYKYFNEVCYMYDFLDKHPEYKMIKYTFTFAYGYQLQYTEK